MEKRVEETAYHLPFLGLKLSLYSSSTAGIRNANVFPLPVLAAPSKSLSAEHQQGKMFIKTSSSQRYDKLKYASTCVQDKILFNFQ